MDSPKIKEEYFKVLDTCKHALCTIGVKGKVSIDRLLGCIVALQDKEMTEEKLDRIISTLNNVSVGGEENLQLMLDVLVLLEQVRDGTFDMGQIENTEEE